MKTTSTLWVTCCLISLCLTLQAQNLTLSDDKLYDVKLMLQTRAAEAAQMKSVVYKEESVTISEPSNRLLYEHEQNVNSFLSIGMKMGMSRTWVVHMSNPRLATHGGVTKWIDRWNENGQHYAPARLWGMIGDLEGKTPKAYLFSPSPFMGRTASDDKSAKPEVKIEQDSLNRFEDHALALLRQGEKLVRWERDSSMHSVGAIRAEAQCLRCHESNKAGDLLGAFTYSFTKSKATPLDEQTKQMLKLSQEGKTLEQIVIDAGLLKTIAPLNTRAIAGASYTVRNKLLEQGVVTTEMVAEQSKFRQQVLETDLGPVKKPQSSAGAE